MIEVKDAKSRLWSSFCSDTVILTFDCQLKRTNTFLERVWHIIENVGLLPDGNPAEEGSALENQAPSLISPTSWAGWGTKNFLQAIGKPGATRQCGPADARSDEFCIHDQREDASSSRFHSRPCQRGRSWVARLRHAYVCIASYKFWSSGHYEYLGYFTASYMAFTDL